MAQGIEHDEVSDRLGHAQARGLGLRPEVLGRESEPKAIVLTDKLPRNAAGKLMRKRLSAMIDVGSRAAQQDEGKQG